MTQFSHVTRSRKAFGGSSTTWALWVSSSRSVDTILPLRSTDNSLELMAWYHHQPWDLRWTGCVPFLMRLYHFSKVHQSSITRVITNNLNTSVFHLLHKRPGVAAGFHSSHVEATLGARLQTKTNCVNRWNQVWLRPGRSESPQPRPHPRPAFVDKIEDWWLMQMWYFLKKSLFSFDKCTKHFISRWIWIWGKNLKGAKNSACALYIMSKF